MKYYCLCLVCLAGGWVGCHSRKVTVYKGIFSRDTTIVLARPVNIKAIGIYPSQGFVSYEFADSMDLAHYKIAEHEVVVLTYYPETGKTDTGVFFMGDTVRLTSCQREPAAYSTKIMIQP